MVFFAGQRLTAADMNAIPGPVGGQWLDNAAGASTSGTTELLVCTSISVDPLASMIYRARYAFRYAAGANAAGDVFFTRIRETNIAGTIRSATRIDVPASGSSPLQAINADYWFNSGSTPSALVFVGTVFRSSGDGVITPIEDTSIEIALMGTPAQFPGI